VFSAYYGVYMAEQSKKETILEELSASSVELKDSSAPAQVMLPSAPIKEAPPAAEPTSLDTKGPASVSETSSSATGSVEASSNFAGNPERGQADDENGSDFASTRDLSPFQRTQLVNPNNANLRPTGLLRHKVVQAACCLFSISFLGLCALDLKSAFTTPAMLDRSFNLTYPAKRPALPPNLSYLSDQELGQDGFYRVVESSWNRSNVGLVDKNGTIVVKPQYTTIGSFKEGLAVVTKPKNVPLKRAPGHTRSYQNDELFGYIDKTGKVVIEPRFEFAKAFNGGVGLVSTNAANSTLIDRTGRVIFREETQRRATDLGGIYAVTEKNGRTGLIDKNGKRILPPEYDGITSFDNRHQVYDYEWDANEEQERYFRISRDGKCGVIDLKGNIIIPPTFREILSYKNGHAVIGQDEKYGFADSNGKVVIKPTYDFVTAYDDLIAVRDGAKWKFINGTGNTVNGANIDGVLIQNGEPWLFDGRGAVIVGDLVGYVDKVGALAIKPIYPWASAFKHGFAAVYDGRLWNYIDTLGRKMTNLKMTSIENFPPSGPVDVTLEGPMYGFGKASEIISTGENFKQQIKTMKRNSETNASDNATE
jgi:hypothetical protein